MRSERRRSPECIATGEMRRKLTSRRQPGGFRVRPYCDMGGLDLLLSRCAPSNDVVSVCPRARAEPMRRRDFIACVGGAATWPLATRAQQPRKMHRIGVLWHGANAEEEAIYLAALRQGLRDSGYVEGENVVLEMRFPAEATYGPNVPTLYRRAGATISMRSSGSTRPRRSATARCSISRRWQVR